MWILWFAFLVKNYFHFVDSSSNLLSLTCLNIPEYLRANCFEFDVFLFHKYIAVFFIAANGETGCMIDWLPELTFLQLSGS